MKTETSFAYVLRKGVIKAVRRLFESRARRRLAAAPGLWPLLEAYRAETRSTGCQFVDYDALYRHVRRHRPREILECGTGVSTLVLAAALDENAGEGGAPGRVTSMEEDPGWFDMANRLLPERLRKYTDIRLSPTVEDGYALFRGMRYRDVPERPFEFVFVDGPGTRAHSDGTRTFDFDFLHVVRRSDTPVGGIVDGRLTTCYALQKVFGPDRVRFDVFRNLAVIAPCTRRDLRVITRSSPPALARSKRLLAPTRFRLEMEPRSIGENG